MIKKVVIVLFVFVIIIMCIYGYYGGFTSIKVTTESHTSFYGISIKHVGDYRQIGGPMTKLDSKMRLKGIEATKGFGIYYDNPQTTETEKLRAIAGSIIKESDIEKTVELGADAELIEVPDITGYTVRFPYKGTLSFIVAVMKVYPFLTETCKETGFKIETPTIEIYDMKNGEIVFIVPTNLSKERANNWWIGKDEVGNPDNQDSLTAITDSSERIPEEN
jgi:effector-binding domain-containing protein